MKRLPWRAALYLAVLGYLFFDLRVCHGPLREAMRSRRDAAVHEARSRGWVALVNQEPVTREQVDLAVARHLFLRGKKPSDLPERNLAVIRRAALQGLIDEALVRQHADGQGYQAPAEEQAAFIEAWKAAVPDGHWRERAGAQGFSPESLEAELGRIWSRKRWVEHRIEPGVEVTTEEAREWFEEHRLEPGGGLRRGFFEPTKRRLGEVRFRTGEEARAALDGPAGGANFRDLGWVGRGELPEPLDGPVFEAGVPGRVGPLRGPEGWYLFEVREAAAERPLDFEELKPEIVSHLESVRAEETVKILLGKLRKVANLQVFPENL